MNRRQIIKYTSLATGAALGAPLLASLISGCNSEVVSSNVGALKHFGKKEFEILNLLVDLILPETDSPSGTAVGVPDVIDHMVATVYNTADKEEYDGNFKNLAVHLSTMDFFNKNEAEQTDILSKVIRYEDPGLKEVKNGLTSIRQQAIAYYLSNEEIATQFLNYLPVPSIWEPCTPLSELEGKAWAI